MRGYHGRRWPLLFRRRGIPPYNGAPRKFVHIRIMTRDELMRAAFLVSYVVLLVAGVIAILVFFAGVRVSGLR